jgi:hypothetical protein
MFSDAIGAGYLVIAGGKRRIAPSLSKPNLLFPMIPQAKTRSARESDADVSFRRDSL